MAEQREGLQDWDRGSWEVQLSGAGRTERLCGERSKLVGFVQDSEDPQVTRLVLQLAMEEGGSAGGSPRDVAIFLDEKMTRRLQVGMAKLLADLDIGRQLRRHGWTGTGRDPRKTSGEG